MNLSEYVLSPFTPTAQFNMYQFRQDVQIAVRALNEVLDEGLPLHPLQEQRDSVTKWRPVGIGIMGLADMLIKLGMRYGSKEAIELCSNIGSAMANAAMNESANLAKRYGTFPEYNWEYVSHTSYFSSIATHDTMVNVKNNGLRNSQLLTIAPTGTLSTMLGISGGIEPIFANYYTRTTKSLHNEDVEYKVYTPIIKQYMEANNITDDKDLPDFFVTAQTLDYHKRIKMQSIWQSYIDASISSTVNVPNEFTVEDVENLYMEAWENGLKGITIFRDGCERAAILNTDKPKNTSENVSEDQLGRGDVIVVNDDVIGLKRKLITGCGSLHCSAFFDPVSGDLVETYLSKGSAGGCLNSLVGISRMISLAARAGVSIYDIVDQLESTGVCPSYAVRSKVQGDTSKGSCCPVAVGKALLDMYKEIQSMLFCEEDQDIGISLHTSTEAESKSKTSNQIQPKVQCPNCGENLVHEGGCDICKSCGWSKCG